ncbi:MAG TPA: hypothetical protein VH165_33385 [Kofleriaceae bacterium]|nr:hypothetical protein [Kofleriaceae bacterium]
MSRLRFPSHIDLAAGLAGAVVLAGAVALAGCGDDDCGPDGAPDTGLVASADMVTLTYGGLTGGLNGDCPAAGAPSGVVSLTIHGNQTDSDSTGFVTLCVSRPDLLAKQAQTVGLDMAAGAQAQLIDLGGQASNCSFAIDRTQPATGSVTSSGLCGNGGDAAGFAVVVDAMVSLTRTCNTATDSVQVSLRGRVAVAAAAGR